MEGHLDQIRPKGKEVNPVDKNKERAFKREIARLKEEGRLPTFEELTQALLEARREYVPRLRRVKREYRAKISIN